MGKSRLRREFFPFFLKNNAGNAFYESFHVNELQRPEKEHFRDSHNENGYHGNGNEIEIAHEQHIAAYPDKGRGNGEERKP